MLDQLFRKLKKNHIKESRKEEISKMLSGIHKLVEMTAREVMLPRVDVVAVDIESEPRELFNEVANSTFSRFPVYQDTIDNIVGILYVKDLLKVSQNIESLDASAIMRQPFFVPETMYLDVLLHEMKKRRVHIAIVVDEYGGVSGIVCLEDIIEEIVGEIRDEFDNEIEEFLRIGNGTFLIDARLTISKLNEFLSLSIPEEDYDTVGGYVYGLFGKIPARYEKVTDNNVSYIIQTMYGNKIKSIKVVFNEHDKK